MIQGCEDASKDGTKESHSDNQVQNKPLAPGPRYSTQSPTRSTPKRQRTSLNAVNVTPGIINARTSIANHAASQQKIHGVSLGGKLQNLTTTAAALVGTSTAGYVSANVQQTLSGILAAGTPNCTSQATIRTQLLAVNINASTDKLQFHNPAISAAKETQAVMTGCTVGAQPVATTTMTQRLVVNAGRPDGTAARVGTSMVTIPGHTMPVPKASVTALQSGDVTSVHSYSLASASSTSSSGSNLQKMTVLSANRVSAASVTPQKQVVTGLLTSARTLTKRPGGTVHSSDLSSVNNVFSEVLECLSSVNKFILSCTSFTTAAPETRGVDSKALSSIPCTLLSPKPKKLKFDKLPPNNEEIALKRQKVLDHLYKKMQILRIKYYTQQVEYFFLKNGGNMMDFVAWRKKPTPQLIEYLRSHPFDNGENELKLMLEIVSLGSSVLSLTGFTQVQGTGGEQPLQTKSVGNLSSSHSQLLTSRLISMPTVTGSPKASETQTSLSQATVIKPVKQSIVTNKLTTKHNSISAVYDSTIGSQEEIVERAKQEAYVMQRIGDLRKEGLWTLKRLPKVQENPRTKAHWDYLLEEMAWLATDFAQERKWKKAAAKKCARMVMKYHQEKEMKAEKAEKEEQLKLRRIAGQAAKEIKQFWTNIEKLVEYKQQTWLEEKRKKALDSHLNFIVDQTEKYSSWLTQGLNRNFIESTETSRASTPLHESRVSSQKKSHGISDYDKEFCPEKSESDDEETIEREEELMSDYDQAEEIKRLQEESELPIEDLLESLPPEILEKPATPLSCVSSDQNDSQTSLEGNKVKLKEEPLSDSEISKSLSGVVDDDDDDFQATSDEDDDEETILKQEEEEMAIDHAEEIKDLEAENELPIEDLYQKYKDAYASDFEMPESDSSSEDENMSVDENDTSEVDNTSTNMETADDSMEFLATPTQPSTEGKTASKDKNPSKEITDIAAAAESFQPKGNTLSTTQVYTKIPFLLKHTLREYQHIGLDWLNAMNEKKLNGILADEMGLGKTIQTISVLAHLACEKGIWGPHLIVVPTSVMLNWEMEIKKWCPAFKILTYYGTPKERKQKRIGWTKPNAFHICITSYKLVVQDHHSFRRKKWRYFILDEAQHIKNFKSQRWQMLLNFQSSHRLLLTGTPLQNSLMELWSLMHFLMPNVFQSHREFREWFVNPVTGMIEGSHEYNESLIKRLHKVLRPFLLRRLKCEVEKQLPKKYEHVVMCRLSKRQRYLYDDFMSKTKTKETLASGNFLNVINILMQLRKVCNHPNMFEARATLSPFMMPGITYHTASLVWGALDYDPFKHISLWALNFLLIDLELTLTAFAAHRIMKFKSPPNLIEEIDSAKAPPPQCPVGKIRLQFQCSQPTVNFGSSNVTPLHRTPPQTATRMPPISAVTRVPTPAGPGLSAPQRYMVMPGQQHSTPSSRAASPVAAVSGHPIMGQQQQSTEYTLQLLQQSTGGLPVAQLGSIGNQVVTSTPITVQIQQTVQGGGRVSMPLGIGRLVQTSTGQHLLLTPTVSTVTTDSHSVAPAVTAAMSYPCIPNAAANITPMVPNTNIATATVLPQVQKIGAPTAVIPPIMAAFNRPQNMNPMVTSLSTPTTYNKPIGRVAPLNIHPPITQQSISAGISNQTQVQAPKGPVVHSLAKSQTRAKSEVSSNAFALEKPNSLFYLESLSTRRKKARKESLHLLGRTNVQRCAACPIYGSDLIEAVTVTDSVKHSSKSPRWSRGYVNCLNAPFIEQRPRSHWQFTKYLSDIIDTPEKCIEKLKDVISRFVMIVPEVTVPPIQLHVSHPPPSKLCFEKMRAEQFSTQLSTPCALLHPITSNMKTNFPELRLIQYDCGKLQRLAYLLRELKTGLHRILIFTQMTRMLDILEQFLNFHGHTYLRLDGNTKVDQRQALMERFNADKRIFCFILSTRSGGIGVNLTGADTVIFYDSDWNPTMDAQAQDRCHRIGQTRDVHIYRLISERTVEENILKKANQKRILGDLAIEGGNFTTAFFKKNTIHELFGIDVQSANQAKMEVNHNCEETAENQPESSEKFSHVQLEQALGMAEEELDLQAAKTARAEAAAEFAEFDESIPLDCDSRDNEEKSPAEEELDKLMEQLSPVEKYAMQFLESLQEPFSLEQLKFAEDFEAQKREWELGRLKALKEEEERRSGLLNNDDPLLSYSRDDAYNQVYFSTNGQEEMPIWAPPTPPQDDNDLYIDYTMGFFYGQSLVPESQLPPIYIKKENKRLKIDPIVAGNSIAVATRKQKVRKDEMIYIPRSLFDRPTAAILKMRREAKLQKVKGLMVGSSSIPKPLPSFGSLKQQSPVVVNKPTMDTHQDNPEWLVHEDWSTLQVIQNLQGLPLSLIVLTPAHIPNWDLASDAVNLISRLYRSPKQCKNRYESVIVPREEGKILYDTNPKKQKKTKGIYKTKNNRPMRTSQLYLQDNNSSFTALYNGRCEEILSLAKRRAPIVKPWFAQSGKNSRHALALAESGIHYDQPLTPINVAAIRAERIAREKSKNQAAQPAAQTLTQATEQQLATQRQQVQQQTAVTVAGVANITQQQTQAVIASFAQAQQLQQAAQLNKAGLSPGTVTTVSLAKSLTSGIMVNTAAGSPAGTFATITKALGQAGVATVTAQGSVQNATIAALTSSNLRNQRATVTTASGTTTMTVQEMVAAAAAGQVRGLTTCAITSNTSSAPAVVSVAGLTAVQLQAATQRLTASPLTAATTVASAVNQLNTQITGQRNLSHLNQMQTFRQTALLRQRDQQQTIKQQQIKRLQAVQQQGAAGKVTVGAGNALTVAAAQQRAAQQQAAAIKQSVTRPMTEAEMAQLVKRQQQLQQQKQAQLTTAQILAQAQMQQVQQQQAAAITGALQTPVATLVKTVSAPSLGGTSSVAIPVSAVSVGGVNINVNLPQGKAGTVQTKGTTATITNQQLRQLQLQQQLMQARKGSKVTNLAQLAKVQGKGTGLTASALTNQLNTVQIVQGGGSQQAKNLQTAMTVQQIQQAMKQVIPQSIPLQVSSTQGGGAATVTTTISQGQLLSHHAVLQAAGIKPGATVSLAHPSTVTIATTGTSLQTLTAASPSGVGTHARIIPVSQNSTAGIGSASTQQTIKQIQVVSTTPNLAATLQSQAALRGEPNISGSVKPQTTTLPSTTLTTSGMFKGASTVVVGQQQTAAILQQVAASSAAGLTPQQAVTLAVRAAASQAQGQQQVQIQVQQSPHVSLAAQQSAQSRIQQLSQNPTSISLAQSIPVQTGTQTAAVLASNVGGIAADPSLQSPTHVVMQNITASNSQASSLISVATGLAPSSASTTAQVVQAAIQAAKQQQQAAQQQQQQKASPYTMRLRNPPK